MPLLYRKAPVNSIWKGSGNVICLDVQRAMIREDVSIPAFFDEIETALGANRHLDASIDACHREIEDPENFELPARRITERMALTLQGALLVQHAPPAVADAFCFSRLGYRWSGNYSTLLANVDIDAILERALPDTSLLSSDFPN